MKTKTTGIMLGVLMAAALAGCHGVKASADNATLKKGLHYGSTGKLTDEPEVSVPIWSSKQLKEKPEDVTPVKESVR